MIPAFGALAVIALALAGWARARSRAQRLVVRRGRELIRRRRARGAPPAEPRLLLARRSRLDVLAQRYMPRPAVLNERLLATGTTLTIGQFAAASLLLTAVAGLALQLAGMPFLVAIMAALPTGLLGPHFLIDILIKRRRRQFLKLFPEAIGLMVRGLRAGVPVMETIGLVAREIGDPVGGEFQRVRDQVQLGVTPEGALAQASRRIGAPEFNFLVISMGVQRETGGNLAESLENLEQILRKREQMDLKIKAMSSEASASALIIGSLPFVMSALMSVASPSYLQTLFTEPLGHLLLAIGGVSLAVGALVMRQMVRFQI